MLMNEEDLRTFRAVQTKMTAGQSVQSVWSKTPNAPYPKETPGGPVFITAGQVVTIDVSTEGKTESKTQEAIAQSVQEDLEQTPHDAPVAGIVSTTVDNEGHAVDPDHEVVASTTEGVDGTESQASSSQAGKDGAATTSGIAVQSGNENP